jgi:hypothetical protein
VCTAENVLPETPFAVAVAKDFAHLASNAYTGNLHTARRNIQANELLECVSNLTQAHEDFLGRLDLGDTSLSVDELERERYMCGRDRR